MLWELSVMEQRYRAVLEVLAGVPVTSVAERYGVVRQTVHRWVARYMAEGPAGLEDRSHRPRSHPWRLAAPVEAAICELRRSHPRWGPRRLVFEAERQGWGVLSRSSVYRTLIRNGLILPVPRRRRRDQFRRWERERPMELWQMDVTAKLFLSDRTRLKIVTGVDDHSRFCVAAKLVRRATARPVCRALVEALETYGVPEEILTDNGKVFTGRFNRPPTEVLFERVCRQNGITLRHTRRRSPTTTGKIERLHQSLQDELLIPHGPFASVEEAQQALDAWRAEYNTDRPHQSLDMAFPIRRFVPAPPEALRLPPDLTGSTVDTAVADDHSQPPGHPPTPIDGGPLEVTRVVPPAGNMWLAGQQIWLGPALAGRQVTFWVDQTVLHVLLDGARLKTLPSRLSILDLGRLAHDPHARPAGPPPLAPTGSAGVELDRLVNASGNINLDGRQLSVGVDLAGRKVTLRLEGQLMHVVTDGLIVRSLACPVPASRRGRLQGARPASAARPELAPIRVQRRVSRWGSAMVATQILHVGKGHAGKIVDVEVHTDTFHVIIDPDLTLVFPRTQPAEITRYKVAKQQKPSRVRRTSSELETSRIK